MSDPTPLLGVSRHRDTQKVSLWGLVKMWFWGTPPAGKKVNLPRPPAAVLAARTPTAMSRGDGSSASSRETRSRRN